MEKDLYVFSHLRWDFVYQRPQHLMSRFGSEFRIFFFEEPVFDSDEDFFDLRREDEDYNVWIVIPHLNNHETKEELIDRQRKIVNAFAKGRESELLICWYYSPMPLLFSDHLSPDLIVYDCMDELANFKNAPEGIIEMENDLFSKADIVFTGGNSLYNAKKNRHKNIYPMPSAIDKRTFLPARYKLEEHADQQFIPEPRLGFYGVLDERLNLDLIARMADLKPDWHYIFIGPVVKIDPDSLPQRPNIHYLGCKSYKELTAYVSGWDICIMPFALNDATAFISPTKTPEFLAGGKPVISTSIADVVDPYGKLGLVHIADTAPAFIAAAEQELKNADKMEWLKRVDEFLADISWDKTYSKMYRIIHEELQKKFKNEKKLQEYV